MSSKTPPLSTADATGELFEDEELSRSLTALDAKIQAQKHSEIAEKPLPEATSHPHVETHSGPAPEVAPRHSRRPDELSHPSSHPAEQREHETHASHPKPLVSLGDAPIEVRLEVGSVTCSLQRFMQLKPRDLLTLDAPLTDHIELRVGQLVVARGRLLELGGKMGLQITEVKSGLSPVKSASLTMPSAHLPVPKASKKPSVEKTPTTGIDLSKKKATSKKVSTSDREAPEKSQKTRASKRVSQALSEQSMVQGAAGEIGLLEKATASARE